MQTKNNSAERTPGFCVFKSGIPLLGTLCWGFAIWFEYVSMKSSVESRMATMERVSPAKWELIYRTEINFWIQRNYLSGAILVLWLVYLLWRWVRALRRAPL